MAFIVYEIKWSFLSLRAFTLVPVCLSDPSSVTSTSTPLLGQAPCWPHWATLSSSEQSMEYDDFASAHATA